MVIAVASGKGGTGKTTVATNLAVALSHQGQAVQLLDCDVEEPNAHLFFPPTNWQRQAVSVMTPEIDEAACEKCGLCARNCVFHAIAVVAGKTITFPELCHSCGSCAYFCPHHAISEGQRDIGEVMSAEIAGLKLSWGRTDVGTVLTAEVVRAVRHQAGSHIVIVDAPPGVTCPTVAAIKNADICLLVTEPSPFGLHDLKLAAEMARDLHLPVAVMVNRMGRGCSFVLADVKDYCRKHGFPILLEIPLLRELAVCYAQGRLWVDEYEHWQREFSKLWARLEKQAVSRRYW